MKTLLVLASLAAALSLAGVASAAGDGAIVTNDAYCIDASPFAVWCSSVRLTTKLTTTPSGNTILTTNGTFATSATFPFLGCTHTVTSPEHEVWLMREGELVVESRLMSSTTTFGCGGAVLTCTTRAALHYANGDVQIQRYDAACTTE